MSGDPFGQIQNQKPLDLACLSESGQWQPLSFPSTGPAVLQATPAAPPARRSLEWQLRSTLLATTDIPSHDNSRHDNRERSVWLPARVFTLNAGAPTLADRGTNAFYEAWDFDAAAASEVIKTQFVFPDDYVSFVALELLWTNLGAGSGNVYWSALAQSRLPAADLNANAFVTAADEVVAAPAQNILSCYSLSGSVWTPSISAAPTGTIQDLLIVRLGSNAADTLGNDAGLLGVRVRYTADM